LANVILIIEAQSVCSIDIAYDMKACTFTDKPREANFCYTDRITNKNIHTPPRILFIFAESKPHNWIICIMWNAEPLSARLRCQMCYIHLVHRSIGVHICKYCLSFRDSW